MNLKILISNDDGVYAPGIKNLANKLTAKHGVTVVAPLQERSTTGHSISLDTPLRIRQMDDNIYGTTGFPGDCILVGLGHICKDNKPDIVISGINSGANLGQDLYYSGTVAAAREASFHGIPSIAVSLAMKSNEEDAHWDSASDFILKLLELDIHKYIPAFSLLNVNVPNCSKTDLKGVKFTSIGFRDYIESVEERTDTRNKKYYWVAGGLRGHHAIEGTDCVAVEQKYIAVTPHSLIGSKENDFTEIKNLTQKISSF